MKILDIFCSQAQNQTKIESEESSGITDQHHQLAVLYLQVLLTFHKFETHSGLADNSFKDTLSHTGFLDEQ